METLMFDEGPKIKIVDERRDIVERIVIELVERLRSRRDDPSPELENIVQELKRLRGE